LLLPAHRFPRRQVLDAQRISFTRGAKPIMELNEAVRRIFGEHWRLIVFLISLGIGVAAGLHLTDARMYTASARVVLDTQDPQSRAESLAIVDTARAIATSPGQVRDALSAAHVGGRDPMQVAQHHVSVRGLGSSGLFELSVSDRDPRTSAAVVNALAAQMIRARLAVTEGQARQILADLGREIDDLNTRISLLDAKIDLLNEGIAKTSSVEAASSLRRERDDVSQQRDALSQQRGAFESQRTSVTSTASGRPKPAIISRAVPPTRADSSRLIPDVILGALLGLILGVGIAGVIETFRPTLVGAEALTREFRAPFLGTLADQPDAAEASQDATAVAMRLRLAAEAAAVRNVGLVPIGPHVNVRPLAERLEVLSSQGAAAAPAEGPPVERAEAAVVGRPWRVATGTLAASAPSPVRIRPFEIQSASTSNGSGAGLVLVVPSSVKKTERVEAAHFLTVNRMPLLGLIMYPRPRTALGSLRA
jgi:capsular polysaccharide biosynthesis protein